VETTELHVMADTLFH